MGAEEAAKAIASWCAAGENPALVVGYFDPLLASHAQRLAAAGRDRKLIVAIRDPETPILSSRARAELVAALKCVTLVVLDETESLGQNLTSFEEQDDAASQSFVEHVRRRNGG